MNNSNPAPRSLPFLESETTAFAALNRADAGFSFRACGGTGANVRLSVRESTADVPNGSAGARSERLGCASLLKAHSAGLASGPQDLLTPRTGSSPLALANLSNDGKGCKGYCCNSKRGNGYQLKIDHRTNSGLLAGANTG